MDATWSETRSVPSATRIAQLLAGLVAAAALAGIYPVAAAMAVAMATTLRIDETQPPAPVVVSTGNAERNSMGLRSVRRPNVATAAPL